MIAKGLFSKRLLYVPSRNFTNFGHKFEHYLKLGRYDKPIGTLLLFLPCTWGIALGLPTLDNVECIICKKQKNKLILI